MTAARLWVTPDDLGLLADRYELTSAAVEALHDRALSDLAPRGNH